MEKEANGRLAKKFITPSSQWSKRYDKNPIGTAKIYQTKPSAPVTKPKSIVNGMKGKIKIFAGNATSDKLPIL